MIKTGLIKVKSIDSEEIEMTRTKNKKNSINKNNDSYNKDDNEIQN